MTKLITAEEATHITENAIATYQDSVDEAIFEKIREAASNRKYQISLKRSPTNAEVKAIETLGYRYKFDCWEWSEYHIIEWGPIKESFISKLIKRFGKIK